MKEKGFFQTYWKWLVSIFFVPLITTILWFNFDGFVPRGEASIDSWLVFWGGFMAFFGTISLGFVAVWQTNKSHKLNEKMLKSNEEQNKINRILQHELYKIEEFIRAGNSFSQSIDVSNMNLGVLMKKTQAMLIMRLVKLKQCSVLKAD